MLLRGRATSLSSAAEYKACKSLIVLIVLSLRSNTHNTLRSRSVAFHLAESPSLPAGSTITCLEANKIAGAASGKGGGFMARQWGDGTSTQTLHELAFDMYEELCPKLGKLR